MALLAPLVIPGWHCWCSWWSLGGTAGPLGGPWMARVGQVLQIAEEELQGELQEEQQQVFFGFRKPSQWGGGVKGVNGVFTPPWAVYFPPLYPRGQKVNVLATSHVFSHACLWWPSLGAEKRAFDPKAPKHVFEGLLHPPPFEEKVLFKAYDPFGEVRLGRWKISFGTEGSETCF
jgi:hypothetical protein